MIRDSYPRALKRPAKVMLLGATCLTFFVGLLVAMATDRGEHPLAETVQELEDDAAIRASVKEAKQLVSDHMRQDGPVKASMANIKINKLVLTYLLKVMRKSEHRTAPSINEIKALLRDLFHRLNLGDELDARKLHLQAWDIKRLLQSVRDKWAKLRARPVKDIRFSRSMETLWINNSPLGHWNNTSMTFSG
jgi:hypothetical protein